MSNSIQYSTLLDARKRMMPALLSNASDRDKGGSATNLLGLSHRFVGVAEYLVNRDVDAFRRELTLSARCRLRLLERYMSGEAVSHSYAAITGSYKALLDALAAANFELACVLANQIGGRAKIESEHDQKFDLAFGYLLKSIVLRLDDLAFRLSSFREITSLTSNRDFSGYADALSYLVDTTGSDNSKSFELIVEGHKRQSKGGVFKGTEDEMLCVWGVALINLFIWRGVDVNFSDDLIPSDLRCPE